MKKRIVALHPDIKFNLPTATETGETFHTVDTTVHSLSTTRWRRRRRGLGSLWRWQPS